MYLITEGAKAAGRRLSLEAAQAVEERAADAYNAQEWDAAIALFLEAQRLGLDHAGIHAALGTAYMRIGHRVEALASYRLAIWRGWQDPLVLNNLIFLLDHDPETTLESALENRKAWWRLFGAPLRSTWRRHDNQADPERPLRIGYVGGDFRRHSAAQAFGPVVMGHSPAFQAICYHTKAVEDPITVRFEEGVTEFHRVHALDDEALAAKIRADQIDILVDLAAFSDGGRLSLFCRRPAPVQVTGWGYATGTGLPVMDGFFADEVLVPPALAARGVVEPILTLPCVVASTRMPEFTPAVPLPALSRGSFTFASFNRWVKVTRETLDTWAEVLACAPGSHLVLKAGAYERPEIQAEVLTIMAARGVTADRIEFCGHTDHVQHLTAYHEVDLALDPFPHSGGVTALEGLWHGVPPLTLIGERPAARVSAAICTAVGLPMFVAETRAEYVGKAVAVATQYQRQLAAIRLSLPDRMAASPLCVGYAEAVERHYRDLWRAWCRRVAR